MNETLSPLHSSLQNETRRVVTQNHGGSGNNYASTGQGPQHNGTGDIHQNTIHNAVFTSSGTSTPYYYMS